MPPVQSMAWNPTSSARPQLPSPSGMTSTRVTADSGNGSTCSSSAKGSGVAPLSVNALGYAPSTSTRQVPSSGTSSRPRRRTSWHFCSPGLHDERADHLPAACIEALVAEEANVLHVRDARAQQRLCRLVCGVLDDPGLRYWTWRSLVPEVPELGRLSHRHCDQHRGTRVPGVAHSDVVRTHTAGHGGALPARQPAGARNEGGSGRWAVRARRDGDSRRRPRARRDSGRLAVSRPHRRVGLHRLAGAPMTKRRIEPLLWLLFSAGGVVSAVFLPILVILFGLAIPLGWVQPDYNHLHAVVSHWLTRLVLLGLLVLMLFHGAHRFRFTLHDGLQLRRLATPIPLLCYGGALLGSLAALLIILTV